MLQNLNKRPPNSLRVVCAIVEQADKVLAVQRSTHMRHPLQWEFPGGKIEQGERPEQALRREILEELHIRIAPEQALAPSQFDYGQGIIHFLPFVCRWESGQIQLQEHCKLQWLSAEELPQLDWLAADVPIYQQYINWASQKS